MKCPCCGKEYEPESIAEIYVCKFCGSFMPRCNDEESNNDAENNWEDEEEEMDGGIGKDLFGDDW